MDTHLEAKELMTCRRHSWPIWGCCRAEEASVGPWPRRDRTQPWCYFYPRSSLSCAIWLFCSGTRPMRQQYDTQHHTRMRSIMQSRPNSAFSARASTCICRYRPILVGRTFMIFLKTLKDDHPADIR